MSNTFRGQLIWSMGQQRVHFERCLSMAQPIRVSRVVRPEQPFLLDELADRVEEDFTQVCR